MRAHTQPSVGSSIVQLPPAVSISLEELTQPLPSPFPLIGWKTEHWIAVSCALMWPTIQSLTAQLASIERQAPEMAQWVRMLVVKVVRT